MKTKVVMVLALIGVFTHGVHAHDVQVDELFYNLDTVNHTAQVTFKGNFYYQFDEYQGDIIIPAKISSNGHTYWVTTMSPAAFANCKSLKSVRIPASIRMVSREAFKNCTNLQTVYLPNSMEVIRHEAFANCAQLTNISFPSSITTICDKAFTRCPHLSAVYTLASNVSDCAFDASCIVHHSEAPKQKVTTTEIAKSPTIISDVDKNIPQAETRNETTLVVVFANENYQELTGVPFAIHDGETFYQYCITALGVPKEHIRLVKDATLNNMRKQINWLSDAISTFNGNARVIVYYAGHGIPDEVTKKAYLLPTDGFGDDTRSAYALDDLYAQLGRTHAKNITVFLDACFSGSTRDEKMLVPTRAAVLKAKEGAPQGNMIVFSATTNDQTAYPINNEGHGMFTYYLLKKLQESNGEASMEEIVEYVRSNVTKRSVLANSKSQTPTVNVSPAIENDWKSWSLK